MTPSTARWLVLASAALFSTSGAAIKIGAFTAAQVSSGRSGIAALVLLAYARGRIRLSPTALWAACLYAATLTLYVGATKLTTAANAVFLQSASPLYILIFGPLFLREQWASRDLAHMGALALGLVLCLSGQAVPSATAPDPATGNVYAVLSGVAFAGTLVFLRRLGQDAPDAREGLTPVIVGNAIASLVALPAAWPWPVAPAAAWATLIYLGVFQVGLAYVCLTRAIRHVPALEASLLLLIEPVLNPIWTWWVHGETPGPGTLIGGAIIVVATAARARLYVARHT